VARAFQVVMGEEAPLAGSRTSRSGRSGRQTAGGRAARLQPGLRGGRRGGRDRSVVLVLDEPDIAVRTAGRSSTSGRCFPSARDAQAVLRSPNVAERGGTL